MHRPINKGERKGLSHIKYQLINIEGTMILESHHVEIIKVNICLGKNHQLMLNNSVEEGNEFHEDQDIYMISK